MIDGWFGKQQTCAFGHTRSSVYVSQLCPVMFGCMYLHQCLVKVFELCDFIVNLLPQTSGKVAKDEGLGVSLLIVVINVSNIEILLRYDDSILVVVAQILRNIMTVVQALYKEMMRIAACTDLQPCTV